MAISRDPLTPEGTERQFGYQWARFTEIAPLHEEQFKRWIAPFPLAAFEGKSFLDVGCGAGRNAYWALKAGAAQAVAIDFDERTLAVARQNLAGFPQCEVRYQSIYGLDETERFDIVFCVGVLHHLADPTHALMRMVQALKPGGTLILWVYGREGNERYLSLVDPLRRHLTSRLPPFLTRLLARALTVALKGYLLWPHQRAYEQLLRGHQFKQLENIVFDQLIPSIAHYWREDEVRALVADLPLDAVTLSRTNGMSWTLVAQKHSSATVPHRTVT